MARKRIQIQPRYAGHRKHAGYRQMVILAVLLFLVAVVMFKLDKFSESRKQNIIREEPAVEGILE